MRNWKKLAWIIVLVPAAILGCDDDKKITHMYGDTFISEEIHEGDVVNYVINCRHGHKHKFTDHCPKN